MNSLRTAPYPLYEVDISKFALDMQGDYDGAELLLNYFKADYTIYDREEIIYYVGFNAEYDSSNLYIPGFFLSQQHDVICDFLFQIGNFKPKTLFNDTLVNKQDLQDYGQKMLDRFLDKLKEHFL